MKASIKTPLLELECEKLECVRISTELNKRIGGNYSKHGTVISLPLEFAYYIADLLPDICKDDEEARQYLEIIPNHEKALISMREVLSSKDLRSVPEFWTQTLDPAQAVAVASMTIVGLQGFCLFDEQGSGKTVMTIAAFDILRERTEIDKMIVLCPKSMTGEWRSSIETFLDQKYRTTILEGDPRQRMEIAMSAFDVLISNYEGISNVISLLNGVTGNKAVLLVVDESFYIKNSEALRSVYASDLRKHCKKCFVLCGTPAPNSAYDVINQFNLADRGYTFMGFQKSKDYEADVETISELIKEKGAFLRRTKNEILDFVPEKNFIIISLELEGRQKRLYEKAKNNLMLELRSLDNKEYKKNLAKYFQKRLILLEICADPRLVDPTFGDISIKYTYLDSLLEDLMSQKRKTIVWAFFKITLEELFSRYKKYNPVKIDGSTNIFDRREAVRRFQDDPETMLFIGNPAAAGAGITLHSSYDAVYFSYTNQAAHYLQSLDRIHRRGQKSSEVNYYMLVCKNTIEETEIVRLRQKELNQRDLLGDRYVWPSSLDEALQELGGTKDETR